MLGAVRMSIYSSIFQAHSDGNTLLRLELGFVEIHAEFITAAAR